MARKFWVRLFASVLAAPVTAGVTVDSGWVAALTGLEGTDMGAETEGAAILPGILVMGTLGGSPPTPPGLKPPGLKPPAPSPPMPPNSWAWAPAPVAARIAKARRSLRRAIFPFLSRLVSCNNV